MTPPETVQALPLLSVICVADGMVVPSGEDKLRGSLLDTHVLPFHDHQPPAEFF